MFEGSITDLILPVFLRSIELAPRARVRWIAACPKWSEIKRPISFWQ
jgi:hypothetical protein